MKNIIQLHSITPDELKEIIQSGLKENLKELLISSNPQQEIYLTRQEAADLLRISLPTLTDYVKRGIIPANRISNRVLFKRSSIEQSLKQIKV